MSDEWASPSGGRPGNRPEDEQTRSWGAPAPTPEQYGRPAPQYGIYGPPPQAGPQVGAQGGPAQYGGQGQYVGPTPAPTYQYQPISPKPGVIALRPLALGDIFEGSFATIRGNPAATLGMALLVGVTCLAPTALIVWGLSQIPTGSDAGSALVSNLSTLATDLVLAVGGIVLTGMLTAVLGEAILGRRMTSAEAWRAAKPRIWPLVLLSLITAGAAIAVVVLVVVIIVLLSLVSAVAAVIVGIVLGLATVLALIYVWTRLSLAAPAVVLERTGPITGLKRSWLLSKGQFWRIFGITLLANILAGIVVSIVSLPLMAILVGTMSTTGSSTQGTISLGAALTSMAISLIVGALIRPFLAGVVGLLYIDQRIRREALDVALMNAANTPAPKP